jgi:hypothetical protein
MDFEACSELKKKVPEYKLLEGGIQYILLITPATTEYLKRYIIEVRTYLFDTEDDEAVEFAKDGKYMLLWLGSDGSGIIPHYTTRSGLG